ncbi:MAG: SDR family NAD(P)-dependent oxidoreductase [Nitrososphaerales archaeon]
MITVEGKVILITGAAQGLGKAYASYLAKAGAKILLADISPKVQSAVEEVKAVGDCIGVYADVTKEEDVSAMIDAAIKHYGRIDALVNNAAMFQGIVKKPFTEISSEEWDKLMAVNLKGTFLCCKEVFPQMKKQGKGKIINISSGTFFSGVPYFAHYVTSKGGIVGLTRALARELGQYNITVNALAPGYTLTEAAKEMEPDPEYAKARVSRRSIHRDQFPEDLTGTMLYLCSDASDFMTGQTIVVNGGDNFH